MDMNFKPGDNDQNVLEKFGRNLNQEVKNNKVDPIIGRDNEIRRVIEIISRKNKNNPVLIGEPGVGKTAIVEGLAQKIVKGDVPSNLKDKVIFELSLPSLIAGASYQGQFEERINSVIKEVKKSNGNIIFPNPHKSKIGYMLQQDSLFPWLTIFENCLIGLKIEKKLTKENIKKVKDLLKTYGLKDFMNSYPKSLSGGMRQRVALIRTLAISPDILLLDEPFSALDYQTRLAVSDDVYRIIKKEKKTVIMVTHDLAEAISMAERIIVLTKRPAEIKKIFKINLTNAKTPIENRKCKEFPIYYQEICKEIDHHV